MNKKTLPDYKKSKIYAWNKKYLNTQPLMLFLKLHCSKLFRSHRTFNFNGTDFKYFQHAYNTTWRTERAVELPIIFEFLYQYKNKRILEVGNVSSHYVDIPHTVVDKYESGVNVNNIDIVEYQTDSKFDLIVTVSTLEHVGWDEEPREPEKVLRAIDKLESLLAPSGVLVVTIPLGQNPYLDDCLNTGRVSFDEMYYMKRISKDNQWIQVEWKEIEGSRDNYPFRAANGLVIGITKNSAILPTKE